MGCSNLKSVDPRGGVRSVINILLWIIRGFLVCVPSRGGAAFLRAGRPFLAEAQEKAIGESLKSAQERRSGGGSRPVVMATTGGRVLTVVLLFCARCLAIHLKK